MHTLVLNDSEEQLSTSQQLLVVMTNDSGYHDDARDANTAVHVGCFILYDIT
jgi:hypothetical protein